MFIYRDVFFFFVKDISTKQMVRCTCTKHCVSLLQNRHQLKTTVEFCLTFKQGHCRPLDQQGNKHTGQIVQSILLSMNNASVYLDCGFLGGKPSVPS